MHVHCSAVLSIFSSSSFLFLLLIIRLDFVWKFLTVFSKRFFTRIIRLKKGGRKFAFASIYARKTLYPVIFTSNLASSSLNSSTLSVSILSLTSFPSRQGRCFHPSTRKLLEQSQHVSSRVNKESLAFQFFQKLKKFS